ncbi:MAG: nucleoside triphosphate pyrophosphohydrolase [Pontibacterium sp.]
MSYALADLLNLMARLRAPDGCPWDQKQTFKSILPYTLEEAYEVADAIEHEQTAQLEEELGDLLFQIVFYAQIGKEQGDFDFDSIVNKLTEKLVRRHPHVFPSGQLYADAGAELALSEAEIAQQWEAIKQTERNDKNKARVLDDVPKALPSLNRAYKLQKRAAGVGFDWPDPMGALDKLEEEIKELREAYQSGDIAAIQDEMGDCLFAQVNIARHFGVKPDDALRSTNLKFERRFNFVEDCVSASGQAWSDYSLAELDAFWDEAKAQEKLNKA